MNIDGKNVTVIGITGTIGSGKSTVGKILMQMDIPVIDTDKIVHELYESNEVKELIRQQFPKTAAELSDGNIEINRKKLGSIVFQDLKAKKQLESILHPRVRQICKQRIVDYATELINPKMVAVLVPLLFESQLQSMYDQIWTIIVEEGLLRQRLSKRDGMSEAEIDLRLAGQMSQQEKASMANVVLDNSGSEEEIAEKVKQLVETIQRTDEQKSC